MTLNEKVAYIKGLSDGLELDTTKPEGKLIKALIDLTSELCEELENVYDEIDTLHDYAEELDHDLGEIEEYLMDEMDDECDCCDCDDDECDCDCCDACDCDGDCDDCDCDGDCDNCECLETCICGECDACDCCCDDECDCDCCEDEEYYEVECPSCGETICFDSTVDPSNLMCPACNEKFACEIEEDDLKALDGEE